MTVGPAIVAVGYNRPEAMARLLHALRAGRYRRDVPLVISIDQSGDVGTAAVAKGFEWPHGTKRIILHSQRLGLREHILRCGDLTSQYGSIALFEDDIVPAAHFDEFAVAAIQQYGRDDRIGGIGLYSYKLNEFDNRCFEPLDDGSDVYFLQVAASWGQIWTASQWSAFRSWYAKRSGEPLSVAEGTPRQLEAWRANSWKRFYIRYLVMTGRYFVYPRPSLATNMATPGTNTRRPVSIYQVPMSMGSRSWDLRSLDRSLSRHDVFFEIAPECLCALNPTLREPDFDVDLFGAKPRSGMRKPRLLTSRSGKASAGFGLLEGASPASSIAQGVRGNFFRIGKPEDFGSLSVRKRLSLARATQPGRVLNSVVFQMLKPLQSELMIARNAKGGARSNA